MRSAGRHSVTSHALRPASEHAFFARCFAAAVQPSPRNMLLQRLRYTTDSPMSSLAEEGGGGPRDVRQLQANPLYAVNNDGT